jgi:glycosyltransferase involved in cell wall biosynthesis
MLEIDLTLVVPCLNEDKNIVATLDTICRTMADLPYSYEIIVIDDGSTDATGVCVQHYLQAHPELPLSMTKNHKNLGLATSFINGAFLGKGKYYKMVFGDNSEDKESLLTILRRMGDADMVLSYLKSVQGKSHFRIFLSRFYTFLVNFISGYHIRYYNGGTLHLRYNVMRWGPYSFGFGFQAELVTRLLDEGATYVEVPISARHEAKPSFSSALNWRNFLSVTHTLMELSIRRIRRRAIGH